MNEPIPGPSVIHRYFAPEDRLAEVICGLIMILTFTATIGGTFEGTTPHALLIGVLGCNIAWGIVDGATYVLGNLMNRGARARLIKTLTRTPDDPRVGAIVASRLDAVLGNLLTSEQHRQVRRWILDGAARVEPEPTRLKKEDMYTGLACFLIVFVATIPVLLPFLFIKNEVLALRACNGLILVMLFATGWRWAAFANMSRLKTGMALMAIGLVLVIITIVLGG
jgi:VIT1/CCC1 family predicted Fe2+/Mn2+ transporter